MDKELKKKASSFLARFGIKRSGGESKKDKLALAKALEIAGYPPDFNPGTDLPPNSPEQQACFFATPESASVILSGDYVRQLDSMIDLFSALNHFSEGFKLADIGGGAGILSLWCSSELGAKTTVFDHSPKAAEIGQIWAKKFNLPSFDYVETSYEDIKTKAAQDYRVAIGMRPITTEGEMGVIPESDEIYDFYDVLESGNECNCAEMKTLAEAMDHVLVDKGVALLSFPYQDDFFTYNVIRHMENEGFCYCPDLSQCSGKLDSEGIISYASILLAFQKGGVPFPCSQGDAARGIWTYLGFKTGLEIIQRSQLCSYSKLFGDDLLLAEMVVEYASGGRERRRLYCGHGLALMERKTTLGFQQGGLTSNMCIGELYHNNFAQWEKNIEDNKANALTVLESTVDPALKAYVDNLYSDNEG